MVPVTEWRIPTVTVSSVTARPVVFTALVAGVAAKAFAEAKAHIINTASPVTRFRAKRST